MYLVFEIFRDSLFTVSHSLILGGSVLILSSIFSRGRFGLKARRILDGVMSSAYIINAKILLTFDMSIMPKSHCAECTAERGQM